MNLTSNLERSAFFFKSRPAISEGSIETSYGQLNVEVNKVATALIKMGIKPHDHVGICAPNSKEWIIFYFGVIKTGAIAVTLSNTLSYNELAFLISHAKPRYIFTTEDKLESLLKIRNDEYIEGIICEGGDFDLQQLMNKGTGSFKAVDCDRNDTAAILYTGGTTGTPKGVMLSHENIIFSSYNVMFCERSTEKDRALCFLPLNHVFGQIHIMNSTIMSGGCLEIMPFFDIDRTLDAAREGRITKLFGVPTIYARMLSIKNLKDKLGKVRYCFSAAASMAVEVIRQWKEETGLDIYEGYGMTESASAVTYNHFHRHVAGSVGSPVNGVEVQLRDSYGNMVDEGKEGEICIRGHNIMKGYLNNAEGTKDVFWGDGWFRSGDIGYFDEDGYLYIVDRIKDMIITGGENVYPREVEEVIFKIPNVQECAVIGLPDPEWGERVVACVVPYKGMSLDPFKMKAFLKSCLSAYKVPKDIMILDELPKSATGKLLKRELKKKLTQK
ncbi:MAG: AMP-binding protein [Syntrophorhabdaceae bacterium]|nr:AMP-binding protein [Syntrophorhabdaceae bacterium]